MAVRRRQARRHDGRVGGGRRGWAGCAAGCRRRRDTWPTRTRRRNVRRPAVVATRRRRPLAPTQAPSAAATASAGRTGRRPGWTRADRANAPRAHSPDCCWGCRRRRWAAHPPPPAGPPAAPTTHRATTTRTRPGTRRARPRRRSPAPARRWPADPTGRRTPRVPCDRLNCLPAFARGYRSRSDRHRRDDLAASVGCAQEYRRPSTGKEDPCSSASRSPSSRW